MAMVPLIERLGTAAERYADRPALHCAGRSHGYRELYRLAAGIRDALASAGHAGERRVGVLTGDDVHTYAALLALLGSGRAYVPLNNRNPAERLAAIIADAGLRVVLASRPSPALEEAARASGTAVLSTGEVEPAAEALAPAAGRDDLAYILFTSGSTGRPKGVPIYHRSLDRFFDTMLSPEHYELSPDDRFLQMFELTFDLSVVSLLSPLAVGASCHVVPEKGVQYLNILRTLQQQEITFAWMVPSALSYLKRHFDEIRLPSVRYSAFCGEALPQALVEGWAPCVPNARIQNIYGPTEATIACTWYDWDPERSAGEAVNGIVPIGRPMPGVGTLVVDQGLGPVGPGVRGELCLGGEQVTEGYWENPEKTRAAFVTIPELGGHAYRTGDLCFAAEGGDLMYCGRMDFQVKIDGHRIELGEIEHHVRELTGQPMVAVVAAEAEEGRPALRLFLERAAATEEAIRQGLQQRLPPYMIPRSVRFLERMPLNANGKIDRKRLIELARD